MADLQQFENNVSTLLAGSTVTDANPNAEYAIPAGQGVPFYIYVAEGDGEMFPPQSVLGDGNYFLITIEDVSTRNWEIFKVTARSGDKLTISQRGMEPKVGQLPVRHNFPTGSRVEVRWTRDSIERLRTYARNVAAGYLHEQLSPSNSWVIPHNRNKFVEVEIWIDDGAGSFYQAEADVRYVDNNNVLVDFSEAVAGRALIR